MNDKHQSQTTAALKACPFCGSSEASPIESVVHLCHNEWDPDHNPEGDWWTVQCDGCTATMGQFRDPDKAIAAWNARPAPIAEPQDSDAVLSGPALYEAALRWVYEHGMVPDHSRPKWVSRAFDDAFAPIRIAARLEAPIAEDALVERVKEAIKRPGKYLDFTGDHDDWVARAALQAEIDKLADFIMHEVPGEPSENEGAVDTAIRIIRAAIHEKKG